MAVLGFGAAACSKPIPPQSDFVDALRRSGIPAVEARCTAKAVYSTLSESELREVIARGASGVPKNDPASTKDHTDRLTLAITACRTAAESSEPTRQGVPATTAPATTTTAGASFGPTATSTPPADGPTASTSVPTTAGG
ncbi:MAG: hypothetical protein JWM89_822 [Acidimicrobiales bacterium]|nr:hypothetical protein [Acidimicrobiales bacterium]